MIHAGGYENHLNGCEAEDQSVQSITMYLGKSYAAVIANISDLFAAVRTIKHMETVTLNAAQTAKRESMPLIRCSTVIKAIGKSEARILVIQYVSRRRVLFSNETNPCSREGLFLRWQFQAKSHRTPRFDISFENGSSLCRAWRATRS